MRAYERVFDTCGVGFNNPSWTWSELEATLSGRKGRDGRAPGSPSWNAGGDSPAWGRKRQAFEASLTRVPGTVPYAELHCHSNYSFLDGASHPEELVTEAARLGLEALALTDHNGFYGIVRFAEAARAVGLPTVFGTEITLTPGLADHQRVARSEADTLFQVDTGQLPDAHAPDPAGRHLVLLADGPPGYARLARALSLGHLAGEKGAPWFGFADIADAVSGTVWALTGCRKGAVPSALFDDGPSAARRELERLVSAFGRDRVLVELWDHGDPIDSARNDALVEIAHRVGVECIATNNVHYASPAQRKLATAIAAVRARRSLDEIDPWLPAASGAHLRSGAEQLRRFARYPGVVELAGEIGRAAAFDLALVAPNLPPFPCPDGLDEMQYLRRLAEEGATKRYGERLVPGTTRSPAWETIDRELDIIEHLGFAGYFLVVWDLVEFCRRSNIYCQGRGSAANSAVCYALGITKADAVGLGLLFERFLSTERDGPPDIDIDIESTQRERGDPVRLRQARPAPHRTGGQRHHLPRPLGHPRHGQGARPHHRPAGRVREADRRLGRRRGHRRATRLHHPRAGARPRAADRGRTAPPRHPLGRHGHLRPTRDRGVPRGVGPHGQAVGAAVGQGRLRQCRPREVRSARPRHALRAALRGRSHP